MTHKQPFLLLAAFAVILAGAGCATESNDTMNDMDDQAVESQMEDESMDDMEGETVDLEDEDMEADADMADVEADVTFNITGVNFAFSETEMRVSEGDVVRVVFESESGFHDWVVDEFDAATAQVREGEGTTEVVFTADQVGEFEYYCSVGQHRANGMVGTLIVE